METERIVELTAEVMADVAWWVVCFLIGRSRRGKLISASFCSTVKRKPARQLFSDASFGAVAELYMKTGYSGDTDKQRSKRRERSRAGR